MKIVYLNLLFDRNIADGCGMMCSFLTLAVGSNQGKGDVKYAKIYDLFFPLNCRRLFGSPSCCVVDMWRILGHGATDGGLVVGTTIVKPELSPQLKTFGRLAVPSGRVMTLSGAMNRRTIRCSTR